MKSTITIALIFLACAAGLVGWFKCNKNKNTIAPQVPDTTIVRSGAWEDGEPEQFDGEPVLQKSEPLPVKEIIPKPAGNYDSLLKQYVALEKKHVTALQQLNTRNTYLDSVMIDSSKLTTHLSIFNNKLQSIYYDWKPKLEVRIVDRVITKYQQPVRQVYVNYGGGVAYQENMPSLSNWAVTGTVGFSYKDRSDRVYTINGYANTWEQYGVMVIRSGKIRLRK